jgi:Rrf2 family protein
MPDRGQRVRISTKGRYSLEAVLYMALLPDEEYTSTKSIAENTGISDGYLEQLFIPLRKAGLIRGIRGPQGGYLLGRPRDEISAGDILRAVEGSLELVDCVKSGVCPVQDDCMSRHTWQDLYQEITTCVDSITLDKLVEAYHTLDRVEYAI